MYKTGIYFCIYILINIIKTGYIRFHIIIMRNNLWFNTNFIHYEIVIPDRQVIIAIIKTNII